MGCHFKQIALCPGATALQYSLRYSSIQNEIYLKTNRPLRVDSREPASCYGLLHIVPTPSSLLSPARCQSGFLSAVRQPDKTLHFGEGPWSPLPTVQLSKTTDWGGGGSEAGFKQESAITHKCMQSVNELGGAGNRGVRLLFPSCSHPSFPCFNYHFKHHI